MSYNLLSKTTPKAKKQHDCIWCPERIVKGEKYIREISIFDDFQSHAWHPECWEAAQDYFRTNGESEFDAHACKRGTNDEY